VCVTTRYIGCQNMCVAASQYVGCESMCVTAPRYAECEHMCMQPFYANAGGVCRGFGCRVLEFVCGVIRWNI